MSYPRDMGDVKRVEYEEEEEVVVDADLPVQSGGNCAGSTSLFTLRTGVGAKSDADGDVNATSHLCADAIGDMKAARSHLCIGSTSYLV